MKNKYMLLPDDFLKFQFYFQIKEAGKNRSF